ncbi:hypothetical protein P280DRAFT_482998 [Massarina eburnea CBS 473.64]|uniref:Protein kinase domain-containing protein n=1 Tax=Massarina eburnea CBS 473.64 TaxID=1395130 RepID=A0A6A6RT66_9PLEO|nr:hypothetical protein P280DRAFT_482998 [Massarina eburnea CBS 473.64]
METRRTGPTTGIQLPKILARAMSLRAVSSGTSPTTYTNADFNDSPCVPIREELLQCEVCLMRFTNDKDLQSCRKKHQDDPQYIAEFLVSLQKSKNGPNGIRVPGKHERTIPGEMRGPTLNGHIDSSGYSKTSSSSSLSPRHSSKSMSHPLREFWLTHMSPKSYTTAASTFSSYKTTPIWRGPSGILFLYCVMASYQVHRSSAAHGWSMRLSGIHLNPEDELDWSGRGQHVEYEAKEEKEIALKFERIPGNSATAVVYSVICRRIRLARKMVRCSKRLSKEDAVTELKHMDIKPKKILVRPISSVLPSREIYKVYVADFNIARAYMFTADAETDTPTSYTRTYAAPDVVQQEKRGFSADIFSLGCVFMEMIATMLTRHDSDDLLLSKDTSRGSDEREKLRSARCNEDGDTSYHANAAAEQS